VRDKAWVAPAGGAILGTVLGLVAGTRSIADEPWTISVDRSRDILGNALALVFTAMSIVLALASVAAQGVATRYGSRALRLYVRRSVDRWVISTFAFTAMFILAAQFDSRRLDPDSPAPSLGLTIGIVLLVVTAWSVMWYVATIVRWFRVDRVAHNIADVIREAAADQISDRAGSELVGALPPRPDGAVDLLSPGTGFIAEIDADVLLQHCERFGVSIVVTSVIGHAVVEGQPIGWVERSSPENARLRRAVTAHSIDVADAREVAHNVDYGLTALADIATIALSPGVNDPSSAAEVVEELMFLFHDLAAMPLGPYGLVSTSGSRVTVASRRLGELVQFATDQIVAYGLSDRYSRAALQRLARSLQRLDLSPADRADIDAFAETVELPDRI